VIGWMNLKMGKTVSSESKKRGKD